MKLIHTSDWHLGQTFYNYERKREHLTFLAWLSEQIKAHNIELLLIAGDIFDTQNPSAEAQTIYYTFLRDVTSTNPQLQIVIIAGNHDSAARLEAPNPLLESMNITVRGVIRRTYDGGIDFDNLIVPLNNGGVVLAVPYLRQGDYPQSNSYAEGVQTLYSELIKKAKERGATPIIAMGHLQATGSEISDNDKSERTIIGGLESISPKSFDEGVDYTALGHLHKSQRVAKCETIRYAGAPLPMSFAEKNNKQGVTLVTIDKEVDIEILHFDSPIKLLSIAPKPLNEVINAIDNLPNGEITELSPFLEIKVLITEPEPSLRHDIETALEKKAVRLARLEGVIKHHKDDYHPVMSYEELQKINPIDIATDTFKRKYGGECMPDKMREMMENVIKEIER